MPTVKCMVCGQQIEKSEAIPYKNRYVHEQCFNSLAAMATKPQPAKKKTKKADKKVKAPAIKLPVSEEEYSEKKSFFNLLKEISKIDRLGAKEYKISSDMAERYGFTWQGMEDTLRYLTEIQERELNDGGLGLIPYYYEEAQNFYQSLKEIEKRNEGIVLEDLYKTKTIRMKSKPHTDTKLIDIAGIGVDGC